MAKVKVIAGDIEESNWNFNAMFGTAIMQRYTLSIRSKERALI